MSLLNPWVLLGIALALLTTAAGSFYAGVSVESDHRDAQQLVQQIAMHDAYVGKVKVYREIAQQTSQELNDATTKRQSDAVTFRAELARARTGAVQLAVCDPVGTGVRLTGGFVGLYDRALSIGMPDARDPGRTDGADTRPDPVEPAEVLAVHGENAETWAQCRAIARGWQALARRNGWVK